MKAVRVPDKSSALLDRSCRQCRRKLKPGEVLLVHQEIGRPDLHWHARCVGALVERAPADRSVEAFEALRARIIENGSPWGVAS